jgi:hypothetical protein
MAREGESLDRVYSSYGGTTSHSEYFNRFSTTSSGKVFFGPSAFRSLKEFFHGSSSLRKTIWHREGATVGGLLHRRRSCEKKHLRKPRTGTMPKLPIRELRSVLPDAPT